MTDPREVQGLMVEQERPKSNAGVRLTPLGQEPVLPGVPGAYQVMDEGAAKGGDDGNESDGSDGSGAPAASRSDG